METETPNLPSPDTEVPAVVTETPAEVVTETPARQTIEAATDALADEIDAGTLARDPETGRFLPRGKEEAAPTDTVPVTTAPATEGAAEPEVVDGEAPAFTVMLKGQGERGETDLTFEVPDQDTADRLNRLQNDGMRRTTYDKAMAEVETARAERREWETAMQMNPLGTLLTAIPKEAQLAVAAALAAEHWDALVNQLDAFAKDPTARYRTMLDARDTADRAVTDVSRAVEAERQAGKVLAAARSLVPEAVADNVRDLFLRDAEADLIYLADRGTRVTPESVAELLKDRVRLYGFNATAAATPPAPPKPTVVRLAPSAKPAATLTPEAAKAAQDRLAKGITARKNAAAVPAGGKGAVIVRRPLIPAKATIEQVSDILYDTKSWSEAGAP